MGFYGNITNTNRTQFQFDKTYNNRYSMDYYASTDGVYVGRFVLIEYDEYMGADWCTIAFQKTEEINGVNILRFYSGSDLSAKTRYVYGDGNIIEGKYIRVPGKKIEMGGTGQPIIYNKDDPNTILDTLYRINEGTLGEEISVTKISELQSSPYNENYNIDINAYGEGRGYDSTVWQKVYTDGKERYVMIAELNTVVPSFSVSADAPTMSPIAPHFGADSTNIFYRIHWQPAWGLRIRGAGASITADFPNDERILLSKLLENDLPSDEKVVWTRSTYEPSTGRTIKYYYRPGLNNSNLSSIGEWIETEEVTPDETKVGLPAAIYYNKAGFDPGKITYSDKKIVDKISLEPTGLSGNKYNTHDGTGGQTAQEDTQELSIMLPSIGNTMAQIWDLIYGGKEINQSEYRNLNVDWTSGSIVPNSTGIRLVNDSSLNFTYQTKNVSTVAGAINSIHDLMGMIIQEKEDIDPKDSNAIKNLNGDYIYYLKNIGRYYRKHKTYEYTSSEYPSEEDGGKDSLFTRVNIENQSFPHSYYYLDRNSNSPYNPAGYYYPNYILEKNIWHNDKQYYRSATFSTNTNYGPFEASSFKAQFVPYEYFILETDIDYEYDNRKIKGNAYRISLDTEYDKNKVYRTIKILKDLGDNTRIWIGNKYYTGTFARDDNPTLEKFNNYELFILDKGKYHRPSEYDESIPMYKATSFALASSYSPNVQYFTVDTVTMAEGKFVEKIRYILDASVNAQNFYDNIYYFKANDPDTGAETYYKATSFNNTLRYYIKQVEYIKAEDSVTIQAKDANEVNVIAPSSSDLSNYAQYRKGAEGANNRDEYVIVNEQLKQYLNSGLVLIEAPILKDFYAPNLYYYKINDANNPLDGSIIFDSGIKPTEGRQYYNVDGVILGGALNYSGSTKVYEPYKYYYKVGEKYILDTSSAATSGREYYEKKGLYVINDTTGYYPKGMEWNINVSNVPSTITLGTRTEKWELQELYGFARHFNTIHGLILRLNSILEEKDELTRDSNTIQGIINKLRDILVQFNEIYPVQVLVSDNCGRITTTGLQGDEWIDLTYNNGSNVKATHRKYTGTENLTSYTMSGENDNRTLTFGDSFISPSFTFKFDSTGHINSFSTSNKTLIMPKITLTDGTGNIVTNISLTGGENATTAAFTETKANLGNIPLGTYNAVTGDVMGITHETTLGTVINKISTHINNLDVSNDPTTNIYVSSVSQVNGKISTTTATTSTITSLGTITSGTWNASFSAGIIPTAAIADAAVTNVKLASGIDASKITTGILPIGRIDDATIPNAKLIDKTITGAKIADATISNAKLIDKTIESDKIKNVAGDKVLLTDYPDTLEEILPRQSLKNTDNIISALSKLEKRLYDLEHPTT